ncbi:MAG: c-type cytochrome [Chloroflexi bacterium]|nr:c-type cytochrome [Chloroflexota bacterium]
MEQRPDQTTDTMPIVPLVIFFGVMAAILALLLASQPATPRPAAVAVAPTIEATVEVTAEATPEATGEATAEAAAVAWNLDPQAVAAGDTVYHTVCMACHGFNGEGIQGLGKALVGSDFVNSLSDEALAAFIIQGRDVSDPLNTTGVMMPPRGGNPALSDQDVMHTVAYIRSLNVAAGYGPVSAGAAPADGAAAQPTAAPDGEATAEATAAPQVAAVPTTGVPEVVGGIAPEVGQGELNLTAMTGQQAYLWACSLCHGVDGNPVPPLATKPLADSELVQAHDDASLLELLTRPQPPANPEEGFPHPYRGGYPPLTDDQLREVIAFVYTLAQ